MDTPPTRPRLGLVPLIIFGSRWLQAPLYAGLVVAQCVYVALFGKELWHLVTHFAGLDEKEIMLIVLGLIDVVLVSNLLLMVVVGGWETFVSRLGLDRHPDEPEWLGHVNASLIKVKLSMAIIGISAVHLLHTFIDADQIGTPESHVTWDGALWQTVMHLVFVASALGLVLVDRLSARGD